MVLNTVTIATVSNTCTGLQWIWMWVFPRIVESLDNYVTSGTVPLTCKFTISCEQWAGSLQALASARTSTHKWYISGMQYAHMCDSTYTLLACWSHISLCCSLNFKMPDRRQSWARTIFTSTTTQWFRTTNLHPGSCVRCWRIAGPSQEPLPRVCKLARERYSIPCVSWLGMSIDDQ